MSSLDIFKGNALVNSDLFKSLMDLNKKMAGGTGTGRRISIRGGKFRMMVEGEQVAVNKAGELNLVIVNAAGVARTYFEGTYDPENPAPPVCWSHDTRVPAPEVTEENRKAARCADCPMNIKGSGQGESRACRFSQRLAVALEGELDTIYQLQVPAASIFGEAKGSDMGLQAYIKFLSAHNAPAIAVMTKLRFDDNSDAPRLFFSAARPLNEDELKTVLEQRESEEALKAITLTVSQVDGVKAEKSAEKAAEKPKAEKSKPATKRVEVEADEESTAVPEPKKVDKPKAAAPAAQTTSNLADVLAGWDDDDDDD
jgi:hypothetical protein